MNGRRRVLLASIVGLLLLGAIGARLDSSRRHAGLPQLSPGPHVAVSLAGEPTDAVLLPSWRPLAAPERFDGSVAFRFRNGASDITVRLHDRQPATPTVSRQVVGSPTVRWATLDEDPSDLGGLLGQLVPVSTDAFNEALATGEMIGDVVVDASRVPIANGYTAVLGEPSSGGRSAVVVDPVGRSIATATVDDQCCGGTLGPRFIAYTVDTDVVRAEVSTSTGRLEIEPIVDPVTLGRMVLYVAADDQEVYGAQLYAADGGAVWVISTPV